MILSTSPGWSLNIIPGDSLVICILSRPCNLLPRCSIHTRASFNCKLSRLLIHPVCNLWRRIDTSASWHCRRNTSDMPIKNNWFRVCSCIGILICASAIVVVVDCISRSMDLRSISSHVVVSQTVVIVGFETQLFCHMAPVLIKLAFFFFSHVLKVLMAVFLIPKSLFDDFSSLIVEHSLVTGFLQSCASVIIHLLSFNNFTPIAHCSLNFVLIFFLNRAAVLVHFG